MSRYADIFVGCSIAISSGVLIKRVSSTDKEFHFQDWFKARLEDMNIPFSSGGRNTYPDFILDDYSEGYEIKGLAYPGRVTTYDSNSQVPTGKHNGRTIFYVFGRYPATAQNEYPVLDLVICHGDFLNADHGYVHENKSLRDFGSYGDIMIRDRKMYVPRTPYALACGLDEQVTLIIPQEYPDDPRLEEVGRITRVETDRLVVGYSFDLVTNELTPQYKSNPNAGQSHSFIAFRPKGISGPKVSPLNRDARV